MRDLEYYRNLRRPAADVNVGDAVLVQDYRYIDRWGSVTKTARVWITVNVPGVGEYRFRRDTQRDADMGHHFKTPEQAEFDKRVKDAAQTLRDRRVEIVARAMVPDGHLIAMADLLTALDQPAKEA